MKGSSTLGARGTTNSPMSTESPVSSKQSRPPPPPSPFDVVVAVADKDAEVDSDPASSAMSLGSSSCCSICSCKYFFPSPT